MRFWSGAQITVGRDVEGPGLVVLGPQEATTRIPGNDWSLGGISQDGSRLWRPLGEGSLGRVQPPFIQRYAEILASRLEQAEATRPHPAFEMGPVSEARRLHPELANNIERAFERFVEVLSAHFQFEAEAVGNEAMEPYVDGFGPELLVTVGGSVVPLPELPPVVLAPSPWRRAMWWVSTTMQGPVDDDDCPPEKRLRFSGPQPDSDPRLEGIVYFLGACAMAAWGAWEGDPQARFLRVITSLVIGGFRPWSERESA